jgi:hypothetical protein
MPPRTVPSGQSRPHGWRWSRRQGVGVVHREVVHQARHDQGRRGGEEEEGGLGNVAGRQKRHERRC